MRAPLTAENLKAHGFAEGIMNVYNPSVFDLVLSYKYTRYEVIQLIKNNSDVISFGDGDCYWLKKRMSHIFCDIIWTVCPIDYTPPNMYKETEYVNRELFTEFFMYSPQLIDLFLNTKSVSVDKDMIEIYRDSKQLNRCLINYKYLDAGLTLPGNCLLYDHVLMMIAAFRDKNDTYNLVLNILNK